MAIQFKNIIALIISALLMIGLFAWHSCRRVVVERYYTFAPFHVQDLIVSNTGRFAGRVSICPDGVDGCTPGENRMVFDPTNLPGMQLNIVPAATVFTVLRHDHITGLNNIHVSQAQETIADGTYDATLTGTLAVAVEADALGTRSAGAFVHQNISLLATASGGQENYALYSNGGDIRMDPASTDQLGHAILTSIAMNGGGAADLSAATSIQLNEHITSTFNEFTGDSTHTPIVSVGNTKITDGTGIQVKNTNAAQAITGIDMLADTTINAQETTGIFMTRGAGGGGGAGGSNPAGIALIGNAGSVVVGANVGDMAVYSDLQSVVFAADHTTFTSATRLTPSNHWVQDTSVGSPTKSASCDGVGAATVVGNDNAFKVTTGTGSTACVISFKKTWGLAPICGAFPEGVALPTCTVSPTAINCTVNVAGAYNFVCNGQPGST